MIENSLLSCDNGTDKIVDADASLIAKEYYTDYSKYVLQYRALPSVYDGLKPVQRRVIYTANQYPKKLMKTAKLSGATLSLHPHGSVSIDGAINTMAHPSNVFPMFETKGNFGGVDFSAASSRYTECYLSEVARQNFCQFIDYADYEIGEIGEIEPSALPTLIPYSLVSGSEGIGVGLSTKIMPLNILDLIDYYIEYIKTGSFNHKFLIKPDVGYVLLEMDEQEIKDSVYSTKGKIVASSVISQISDSTLLIEGLYDRSIDAILNKIDRSTKWLTDEKVGFRNSSTESARYIFEIYDRSISISDLKKELVDATYRSGSYTRVVEEDGCAIYSGLDYCIKKSLECLNKAIDKMINSSLSENQRILDLYNALELCKSKGVFNNISGITQDQLANNIIQISGCSSEIAYEITKKPISYLTRSHAKEIQDIQHNISDLQSHDRKKYLLKLYRDFKKIITPYYDRMKHTITRSMILSDPRVLFNSSDDIQITDGNGEKFKDTVYFVGETGNIYRRSISTNSATSISVETSDGEKLVGLATDENQYIKVTSEFSDNKDYIGVSIISIDDIPYDKNYFNLREGEKIIKVEGRSRLGEEDRKYLRGSRSTKSGYKKR